MENKINQKAIDNANIYSKERNTSGKIIALKSMKKLAYVYYPQLIPLLDHEMYLEYERIQINNIRRKRISIIGR